MPSRYLIMIRAAIQFVGVGLAIDISLTGDDISARQYDFEAVMGVGFGLAQSKFLTMAQLIVSKENAGVVMRALSQIRVLGGTIALAICSAILHNHPKKSICGVIAVEELEDIFETLGPINWLGSERAAEANYAFAVGYRKQLQLLSFSGASFLASLFPISRRPVTVSGAVGKNKPNSSSSSSSDSNESILRGAPLKAPQATT
ncbi:hypothetical protein MKZ38_006684 [Zalerion maritima]|uniref:Uncharacterized protein n=1 Tax=Zalerion maritima TaxID=339359 RepID=A0AAD5WNM6_9PEZI|nr:hypothetical protein MKZ38_006684 [Zalerion maritima]